MSFKDLSKKTEAIKAAADTPKTDSPKTGDDKAPAAAPEPGKKS
jgi:hypothetical protein